METAYIFNLLNLLLFRSTDHGERCGPLNLGKLLYYLYFLTSLPRGLNVYFGFSTSPRYIPWEHNGLASLVLLEHT